MTIYEENTYKSRDPYVGMFQQSVGPGLKKNFEEGVELMIVRKFASTPDITRVLTSLVMDRSERASRQN
ncbi:hypothetical protein SOMG_02579 [Schizosaccharomyces osmophilus]|uniref:Uncharacterized protein n=1 Tax=Schizosaccharomyces osmophilus TaxID=2545709 RepID=A0AAF0AV34_9SCHI|nr:uncharacterized protein SOMG_02579 [Schizosaccharomyces osmophilus]WBW73156.1 hypothetical protein SOMG_02579 [Schizosaccharomyces osmophilus]